MITLDELAYVFVGGDVWGYVYYLECNQSRTYVLEQAGVLGTCLFARFYVPWLIVGSIFQYVTRRRHFLVGKIQLSYPPLWTLVSLFRPYYFLHVCFPPFSVRLFTVR